MVGFGFDGFGFDGFYTFGIIFFIVFAILFALGIGILIFILVKKISTWNKNNHSPRLTVAADVVAKRADISYHQHANAGDITGANGYHTTSSTMYYVTFQVESGDRMELSMDGSEYGMLAEGDRGKLTFQGTRYLEFERL